MTFGEKLRESRKTAGLSQEELAEKLNVSRQAITKWETGAGIPDIGNLMTISNLFGIALDDFISEEKLAKPAKIRLYESTTEYDIDGAKDFDIKLGGANSITVYGCGSKTSDENNIENNAGAEKIKVVLSSDTFTSLQQDFKTKIDDLKYCIDIDVNRAKKTSETSAREQLHIEVFLPNKYLSHTEIDANCQTLSILNLECKNIEFDGREMSVLFMMNFFISVIPMGFVTTWVYVKNGRSMLASILFHLFVNFMQEKIAMTQVTKCIETVFVVVAAAIIVLTNKDMFFEKRHVGRILEDR